MAIALSAWRISLPLPSSPQQVPAWMFCDDTRLESHIMETLSALMPEKRGKMHRIANDAERDNELQEKKQRKK
jgi:hypothetical protein